MCGTLWFGLYEHLRTYESYFIGATQNVKNSGVHISPIFFILLLKSVPPPNDAAGGHISPTLLTREVKNNLITYNVKCLRRFMYQPEGVLISYRTRFYSK